uniref:Uncharacterized protein LOC114337492 n=1 Tax=Diabrotica virgifera virgifera TaxID=50390 RepID=A0A6P7GFG5_DIAVI
MTAPPPVMFHYYYYYSGAAVTIINKNIFEKYFPVLQLQKSDVKLTTYCKNNLNVLGLVSVEVEHQELKHTLKLYVVDGDGYSLVGREWIHALEINLHQMMVEHGNVM